MTLAKIEVNIKDTWGYHLLLCCLAKFFEYFKDTILYEKKDATTLEELEVTLRTKELTKFKNLKTNDNGEGSNASRGRSQHIRKGTGKSRSKSRPKGFDKSKYICFICRKSDIFKNDCLRKRANDSSSIQVVVADKCQKGVK